MSAAAALLRRELAGAWGGGGGPLTACAFVAAVAVLTPLAGAAAREALAAAAPGLAWLALALASVLSLERLFERDLEDGSLDLLALGPLPLEAVVAAKALAQWIAVGLPLALVTPVAAMALGLPPALGPVAAAGAALGGLGLAFTGALGAAVALGARRGGLLIAVVVLPLFIPPVVFGGGALSRGAQGLDPLPALALLAAYVLFAALVAVFGAAAAIRNALD
jgi:heme exporter protein B